MNYKKIIFRAKQFGGIKLAITYMKLGMGFLVFINSAKMIMGLKTRDEAYSSISRVANMKLQKQYKEFLVKRKSYYDNMFFEQKYSDRVWTCWLQGFETAPDLVKSCVSSMKKNLIGKEIMLISLSNYFEYITIPNDIVQKYKKGIIPPALFSDLIRLELLITYGGTWMDSTILCTGQARGWDEIMRCELFVFQTIVDDSKHLYGISNWFISSCTNNRLLMILRDLLLQYWRDYDCAVNYYIFHDFFYTIAQLYPEEIAAMPRKNRLLPLMLMQRMGDTYDEKWMAELMKRCCFHKLNYRISDAVKDDKDNFYHAVISRQYEMIFRG